MGRAIKATDQLYQRLKERAAEERSTLQDALTQLVTEPILELEKVRSQLKETKASLAKLDRSDKQLADKSEELLDELKNAQSVVSMLRDQRVKDGKAWDSWVPTWKKVEALVAEVETLSERVQRLEHASHRHWGQRLEESDE